MFGSTHWLSRHWTWLNWLVVNRPATQQSRHVPHLLHGSKCKSTHSYEHPQRERVWERGRKRESYQLCIEWLHLREYRNNQTSCFLSSTTACAHWTHLRRGNVGEILSWCCNPFQLRGVFFPLCILREAGSSYIPLDYGLPCKQAGPLCQMLLGNIVGVFICLDDLQTFRPWANIRIKP